MDCGDDIREVYLKPGDFHFGTGRTRLRTLLGSCVAIALWHPERRIGGMCHYLLPERPGKRNPATIDGRYAEDAMELFLASLHRAGTAPGEFRVNLFGGAHMLPHLTADGSGGDLPRRNVSRAHELLARYGFVLEAQHVGGKRHRTVALDLWSGDVWLKVQ